MQEDQTWRDFLGKIIDDPRQKQHLVEAMNIRAITLERWVRGDGFPRLQNLRSLLNNLPQQREQLLDLFREDENFVDFADTLQEDTSQEIPGEFYRQVLKQRESINDTLRFWSISTLILQRVLEQLDPDKQGMSVIVVRCMPPLPGETTVRSLRESVGRGTPPWNEDLEHHALFLGAESLAGHVVSVGRFRTIQDIREDQYLIPAQPVEHEISAAAFPIMYTGLIAGCFLISSTLPNYFLSQTRLTLIQYFTDLLALAFEPEDFFEHKDIALGIMPSQDIQKAHFANFRQLINYAMINGTKDRPALTHAQAEEQVWRKLEAELLALGARATE